MIRKLLVANRGEIAVRIIAACRELGVESVAVYSEADADAVHVKAADRAVAIGPAPARESYLSIANVIAAAKAAGADAIHPGYGFLSENAAFAAACEAEGLTFVGPPAAIIERMGSKIEARRLMESAGIPVVPGGTPADQSDDGIVAAVRHVGLPALIKASAGGGGKGMRRVWAEAEVREAAQAARREATAAFGDGTLYVERLIERPHHVEVQVVGDVDGRIVHVFERECSVQRRHQKVIEESPSPSITAEVRRRLTEAGAAAARAARYRNAGTIEFLVDAAAGSGDAVPFYFLEMNTRLQVEHPVTELTAGVDLVRAQILIASGQPVPWRQDALVQRGHAIEARVYAEDPSRGFLPQAGRVLAYREPRLPGVRVDSGIAEGSDVPVHYDPLLAKVIAWAETRDLAIARLAAALRSFTIEGIVTNIAFLLRILEHPRFRAGTVDTGFLDREGASLADSAGSGVASAGIPAPGGAAADPVMSGLRGTANPVVSGFSRTGGDDARPIDGWWDPWSGQKSGRAHLSAEAPTTRLSRRRVAGAAEQTLTAPMPATVIKVLVAAGDAVKHGDTLVVLEAMKMELPLRAAGDAVVKAVNCRAGDLVQPDAVLVELS